MANDTIVLSPELNNWGRREHLAIVTPIPVGSMLNYGAQGVALAGAGAKTNMIATENIANATGIVYTYAVDENVFFQSLPRGAVVKVQADPLSYTGGEQLEVNAQGQVTIYDDQGDAEIIAVIPPFGGGLPDSDGFIIVELL